MSKGKKIAIIGIALAIIGGIAWWLYSAGILDRFRNNTPTPDQLNLVKTDPRFYINPAGGVNMHTAGYTTVGFDWSLGSNATVLIISDGRRIDIPAEVTTAYNAATTAADKINVINQWILSAGIK